jgi:molybdopterin converting factor small subunit
VRRIRIAAHLRGSENPDCRHRSTRRRYAAGVATLRLPAAARAPSARADVPGGTVDDVLTAAVGRYGAAFEQVLASCKVWVNGDEAGRATPVGDGDEVAVLPPVSGGS